MKVLSYIFVFHHFRTNMLRKLYLGILKKCKFLPQKYFVKVYYEYYTGKNLNLDAPKEFNEKIQWLKVFYRPRILNELVDKYAVRQYVKDKIGEHYLNHVIQITSDVGSIDFRSLPQRFVAKATHGCNFNLIVKDKSKLNEFKARLKFRKWLSKNQYYRGGMEWAYKDIPPRILLEHYLEASGKTVLDDYKFYCFHGKPMMVQIDIDRGEKHRRLFLDMSWTPLPFCKGSVPLYDDSVPEPPNFHKMGKLAEKLADNFPFVRVDLFNVDGAIYFGEMTFYPGDGRQEFIPDEYNRIVGDMLQLPQIPQGESYIKTIQ